MSVAHLEVGCSPSSSSSAHRKAFPRRNVRHGPEEVEGPRSYNRDHTEIRVPAERLGLGLRVWPEADCLHFGAPCWASREGKKRTRRRAAEQANLEAPPVRLKLNRCKRGRDDAGRRQERPGSREEAPPAASKPTAGALGASGKGVFFEREGTAKAIAGTSATSPTTSTSCRGDSRGDPGGGCSGGDSGPMHFYFNIGEENQNYEQEPHSSAPRDNDYYYAPLFTAKPRGRNHDASCWRPVFPAVRGDVHGCAPGSSDKRFLKCRRRGSSTAPPQGPLLTRRASAAFRTTSSWLSLGFALLATCFSSSVIPSVHAALEYTHPTMELPRQLQDHDGPGTATGNPQTLDILVPPVHDDGMTSAARRFLYILNSQLERTTGQSPVSAGPDRGYVANGWFTSKVSNEVSSLLPAVYPTTTLALKVKQGLSYAQVRLRSQGSTNEDGWAVSGNFTAKLLAQGADCSKTAVSVMGAPFNGLPNMHDAAAGVSRGTITYSKVIFPVAGFFQLCYTRDEVSYEVLDPVIEVEGSERYDNKWFCSLALMHANRLGCQNEPYDDGCQCQGQLAGYQQTGSSLVRLGNDTASGYDGSQFKIALQNWEGAGSTVYYCGDGDSGHSLQEPFDVRIAEVLSSTTKSITYNFKKLKTTQNQPYIFRMCYCLGFDWDTSDANPACQQDQQQAFATEIGSLVIIQTRVFHNNAEVGAFPTLKWQLVLDCGCKRGQSCDQGGGCSQSADKGYKIVKQSVLNNKPQFEDTSGCRFAEQIAAQVQTDVNRIEGGQFNPPNCFGAADCRHQADSAVEIKTPTWSDVQISGSYHNEVMLTRFYDVCYCDVECKVAANWFKAGVLQMRPLKASIFVTGELSLITPPVINTDFSVVIRTPTTIPINTAETGPVSTTNIGSFSSMSSGEATREMKILEDPLALTTPQHCLRYAQSSLVSGHAQVNPNSNIDYAQPAGGIDNSGAITASPTGLGFKYGFANSLPTIKISEPGFFAICYCDQECNAEANWLVVHRQIISGPTPNQKWTRVTGVTFNLRLTGHLFQTSNRIIALEATNELADCGAVAPTTRFFGPKVLNPQLSSNIAVMDVSPAGPSNARGIVRDASGRGSVIEFSAQHGLKDDDQIYLKVQWDETMLRGLGYSDIQIEEIRGMYTNLHRVSVLCDYVSYTVPGTVQIIPACHKILIPVKFSASDFPYKDPVTITKTNEVVTAMEWTRSSEQEFILMKVSAPSPDSRGYVICWAQQDAAYNSVGANLPTHALYKAPVGYLIVKDPEKMRNSWLSLTSIENSVYSGAVTERISPMIVTFETGTSARYTAATGEMGIKLTFENKESLNAATGRQEWQPVVIPYDQSDPQKKSADASGNSSPAQLARTNTKTLKDLIPDANQKMCGDIFVELWGEHENGFPQPKKCFAFYDDASHTLGNIDQNAVVELYVFFHAKNGLAPSTQYQIVFYGTFNELLTKDQPAQGAVKIYTLDEDFGNRFEVIESGDAKPEPQDVVPPANAADRWSQTMPALKYTGTGPLGFRLMDTDGTDDGYMALTRYCIKTDATPATPSATYSCSPCEREEDCGNGRVATPAAAAIEPSEDLNWCQSPVQLDCFADQQELTEFPLFKFRLLPEDDAKPLTGGHIVKIFLHPLTQWDIGGNNCDMYYEAASGGGGSLQKIGGCDKGSVTFRTGTMTDNPEQQVNYIKLTIPVGMTITSSSQPTFHLGGALPVPKWGYFPTHFSAEFTREKDKGGRYLSQRDLEKIAVSNNAKNFVRPWSPVARILSRIGPTNGNQAPFSTQTNLLYMQLTFGTMLFADKNERITVRIVAPELSGDEGAYKCQLSLGGLPVPDDIEYLQSKGTPNGRGTIGSQPIGPDGTTVGLDVTKEGTYGAQNTNPFCQVQFREHLMINAGSSIFVPFAMINPEPLKVANAKNKWELQIFYAGLPSGIQVNLNDGFAIPKKFTPRRYSGIKNAPVTNGVSYGRIMDDADFSHNTAVLGKLEMNVLQPEFFANDFLMNEIAVFFKTKQGVGSQTDPYSQIWVDAPKDFDYSQYCLVTDLPDIYYVPEPAEPTNLLPRATPDASITCLGSIVPGSGTSAGTYNRARLSIDGRLLVGTIYGFKLRVKNAPSWEMTQRNSWRISTYENSGTEKIDASQFSPRSNQEDPGRPDSDPNTNPLTRLLPWDYDPGQESLSWATYLEDLPTVQNPLDMLYYSTHFVVQMGDMRPNAAGTPTDITIFPIMVKTSTQPVHVRLVAPHGYKWSFTPAEFLYESIASGVPEAQAVAGAELDFPLSLVPPMPIVKPLNELKIDSVRSGFLAGVRYGIKTKITVPNFTSVDSLNRFTIEFGYDELTGERRYAAGSYPAPIVRKLLNANVDYVTSLVAAANRITFSLQTITDIARGGGLVITGPSGFYFPFRATPQPPCLPIAVDPPPGVRNPPNTDLPFDATCTSTNDGTTNIPTITITAGPQGIPARQYAFILDCTNPGTIVTDAAAGSWTIASYALASVKTAESILDFQTTVPSFGITNFMPMAALVSKPWKQCGEDYSLCQAPEEWQYQAPRGLRNDRPKRGTHLIFKFMMNCNTDDNQDAVGHPTCRTTEGLPNELEMKVNAPEGYLFDLNCDVVTASHLVLWANNPTLTMPSGYSMCCGESDVKNWPTGTSAQVLSCKGNRNKARIKMRRGLKGKSVYLFRLAVQSTPSANPDYNKWTLEFNSETSLPFDGYNIWSFTDYAVTPRDSSISNRVGVLVENEVTIALRLRNIVAVGGYFRMVAPVGFEIQTECAVTVYVTQKEQTRFCDYENSRTVAQLFQETGSTIRWCPRPDTGNQVARWADFAPLNAAGTVAPAVECKGDERPSNNVRVKLMFDKVMLPDVRYNIALMLKNPLAVQQEAQDWEVRSFRPLSDPGDEVQREMDSTTMPGFPVNFQVTTFSLLVPADRNADYEVVFVFAMSFQQDVVAGEKVVILAPAGYLMAKQGTNACTDYVHLLGFLARTTPACGGNMITWTLVDDRAPADDLISFSLKTTNPGMTPSPNYFSIRVMETDTERMIASKVFEGYAVIPALLGLVVENIAALPNTPSQSNNQHSCRGHIDAAYNLIILQQPCRATGSLGTLRITFTARSPANLLRITGWVFSGIPRVSSTQIEAVPAYEQIVIPNNRLQVESYRSAPGAANSNRVKFSEVDSKQTFSTSTGVYTATILSMQFNSSEILLLPLKTPTLTASGAQADTTIDGIAAGTRRVIEIPKITLPPVSGVLLWDIASFQVADNAVPQLPWYVDNGDTADIQKKDEVKLFYTGGTVGVTQEVVADVLPYIELTSASTLLPAQFGQMNARVMLEIILNAPIYRDEVLFITRPSGYRFVPDSFMPASPNLQYTSAELAQGLTYAHGVDTVYSQPGDPLLPPTRYYFQIVRFAQAGSALVVEFNVDVPTMPYSDTHWFVEMYFIRPKVDADGNVLPGLTTYPWDDLQPNEVRQGGDDPARWQRRMTNDGSFEGFFLVGDMGQITLNPSGTANSGGRTPGAQIDLEIKFFIKDKVEAPNVLDKLRLEVLAPPNYRFSASCLVSQGEVTRFTRCNGNNNKAELETSSNSIHGPQDGDLPIPVVLQVINPPIHSDSTEINSWRLQLFRGAETQPSNVGTTAGYKIQSMTASYIGNNRLGGAGSSFFKFKPNQMMPTGGSLQIVPPQPQGGYDLRTNGVHKGSLPEVPRAMAAGVDQPLLLELKESTLQANVEYVFGIGVVNPSTVNTLPGYQNKWGLRLVTRDGRTVDANMRIDGVELLSIDLAFELFAWNNVAPQEMSVLLMELVASNPLPEGEIEWFSIESPEGVMFNDPNGVQVVGLPLIATKPFRIAGNQLIIELQPNAPIPEGVIAIQFAVKNPSRVPTDNKWVVRGMKGKREKFLDVVPGYLFGQTSPKLVTGSMKGLGGAAGTGSRKRGSPGGWWSWSTGVTGILAAVHVFFVIMTGDVGGIW